MSNAEIIWNGIGAFLTLCIFSFLYKDNPFYKVAEHLVVGISAGYFAIILFWNGLIPNLINRLFGEVRSQSFLFLVSDVVKGIPAIFKHEYWYLIPGILGVLMFTRFSPKYSWISRYPIAIYMGVGTGVAVPLYMQVYVINQVHGTMVPLGFANWKLINSTLIAIGVLCSLIYFFFSALHKGVLKPVSRLGIWTLMIGFGAGFGMTVMGRVSL